MDRNTPQARLLLVWRVLFWFCAVAGLLMAVFVVLELISPDRDRPAASFLPAVLLLLIWAVLTRFIGVQVRRLRPPRR